MVLELTSSDGNFSEKQGKGESMEARIDNKQFGPWALITGASSGIGREFARQVAAAGINVVLAARRRSLLEELGHTLKDRYGVEHRVVEADFFESGLLDKLSAATDNLDIGLVVSNAGTGELGEFLKRNREDLLRMVRLNAIAHLEIAHYFGERLARRGRGGLLLGGAMGAVYGLPYMAGDSASKAFVQTLGEALHVELQPLGVHVTVLVVGPTNTAIIPKFGLDARTMPMKPMSAEQCASEGLTALAQNRATHIPGRANRIMNTIMPASVARRMMGKMLGKASAKQRQIQTGVAT
jgi:uncharacterized protein